MTSTATGLLNSIPVPSKQWLNVSQQQQVRVVSQLWQWSDAGIYCIDSASGYCNIATNTNSNTTNFNCSDTTLQAGKNNGFHWVEKMLARKQPSFCKCRCWSCKAAHSCRVPQSIVVVITTYQQSSKHWRIRLFLRNWITVGGEMPRNGHFLFEIWREKQEQAYPTHSLCYSNNSFSHCHSHN